MIILWSHETRETIKFVLIGNKPDGVSENICRCSCAALCFSSPKTLLNAKDGKYFIHFRRVLGDLIRGVHCRHGLLQFPRHCPRDWLTSEYDGRS